MKIINHKTNDYALMEYKERGWSGKNAFFGAGTIFRSDNTAMIKVDTRWNSYAKFTIIETGEDHILWQRHDPVP